MGRDVEAKPKRERGMAPAELTGLGQAEGTRSQGLEAGGVAHGSPVAYGAGSACGGAGAAGQTGGAPEGRAPSAQHGRGFLSGQRGVTRVVGGLGGAGGQGGDLISLFRFLHC